MEGERNDRGSGPLAEILRSIRLSGGVFLRANIRGDWCLRSHLSVEELEPSFSSASDLLLYHLVLEGELRVRLDEGQEAQFTPGQIAILPRYEPHLLGNDLSLKPTSAKEVTRTESGDLAHIEFGTGPQTSRMICGYLASSSRLLQALVASLPALLKHDTMQSPSGAWIRETMRFAASETEAGRVGSDLLFARLSEVLFLESLRDHIRTGAGAHRVGPVRALADPVVSSVLAIFHSDPASAWNLATVAKRVGASRSVVAERFKSTLEVSPMDYLTQVRMDRALELLESRELSVSEIAIRVGYDSSAGFSRAFRRHFGRTPTSVRRSTVR